MNTKREPEKTLLDKYLEDPEFARLMAQGDLIMEVTETLCELLEKEKISRKELADRLGKSKGVYLPIAEWRPESYSADCG